MNLPLQRSSAIWLSLALLSATASVGAQTASSTGTIKYAGSSTVAQTVLVPKQADFQKTSGLTLEIANKTSGSGLLELAKGTVDVAGISGDLSNVAIAANKVAEANKLTISLPKNLITHDIGRDKIVLIVNAKNSFNGALSKDQLQAIFTQKISNWKELGGEDAKITLVVPPADSGTYDFFRHAVMDGRALPVNAGPEKSGEFKSYSSASEINAVSQLKYSIAAASSELAEGRESVRIIKTPVIERPLSLVTVGAPSPKVQKLIDFLKK